MKNSTSLLFYFAEVTKFKMAESFVTRLKNAWNIFRNKDPSRALYENVGPGYYYNPDRRLRRTGSERSLIMAIYNRIALDAASIPLMHVRLDEQDRYVETINSPLNNCLTLEANIDQTGRAFLLDVYISMLDEGHVALVPTVTSSENISREQGSFDIYSMRVGKIVKWHPNHVAVEVYDELSGNKREIMLPKSVVAIVENPFYSVMNAPNSTLQRLIRKLSLLDVIDEQSSSGKLDMIIQLPYVVKGELKKQQAEERRRQIEEQLSGSKFGIAYIDGTERVTQLNRPIENNLMSQIEYLTNLLYSQMGFAQGIMDGTADDKTMLNYNNRLIEPVVSSVADELKRKYLSKTARTQGQSISFFRDPFKLVPVSQIAEIADKFTRNEILSSNEIRQIIGIRPSSDPAADELRNKNLNKSSQEIGQESIDKQFQNEGSDVDAE